ncbi:MAG: helix-turn-helix domain-containing protein [Sinobacterium sp.]|nr:helix-turn-helix domain-containing protein [Sinobacterium sp.]
MNLNIHIIITPQCLISSLALPLEMFQAAHEFARTQRSIPRNSQLHIRYISELANNDDHAGFHAQPYTPIESLNQHPPADLILIPSLWRHPLRTARHQQAIIKYIKHASENGSTLCAAGTGSSFLATAGILDNHAATTHWFYFDEMERAFPKVIWKRSHRITQSKRIYCAGSINSVADLSIHLIEQYYSASIANAVANQFSPEARQPLQEQLFNEQSISGHQDELIAETQEIIQQQLHQTINSQALAQKLNLSVRSLQRRFKHATGITIIQYQQTLRIDLAKSLLRDTNAGIEEIALLNGFSDSSHFSRVFKQHIQLTPKQYRINVRSKLFEPHNIE